MNNPNGQAHYMPRDLGWGRNSRVHWSIAPRGRAIVFVHGFGGAATSTWNQFAALLTGRSECAEIGTFWDMARLGRGAAHAQENLVDAEGTGNLDQSED